jgi:hypothetical protein
MQKRRTIVQRAAAAHQYARPRNVIIQYEPVQVRVVRQFQRLGVTQENPQAYISRYGTSLFDAQTLLQQARAAGVIEDISPPAGAAFGFGAASYGQESSSFAASSGSGFEGGAVGFEGGAVGVGGGLAGASSFESSSFESSSGGYGGAAGGGYGGAVGVGGGYGGATGGGYGFESSSSYGASGASGAGFDPLAAAFGTADRNKDGRIDRGEFQNFYQGGL